MAAPGRIEKHRSAAKFPQKLQIPGVAGIDGIGGAGCFRRGELVVVNIERDRFRAADRAHLDRLNPESADAEDQHAVFRSDLEALDHRVIRHAAAARDDAGLRLVHVVRDLDKALRLRQHILGKAAVHRDAETSAQIFAERVSAAAAVFAGAARHIGGADDAVADLHIGHSAADPP